MVTGARLDRANVARRLAEDDNATNNPNPSESEKP
jgi:hypothetical protein